MLIPMQDGWKHGATLFNSGQFFEAHEALEDLWRDAPTDGRLRCHLQGLVQLAVAFHHHSTGNLTGARSVLERALRNLDGAEQSFPELDWAILRSNLAAWRLYLAQDQQEAKDSSPPEPPKLLHRRRSE
jgi:predicted metal-dependent hydrolase